MKIISFYLVVKNDGWHTLQMYIIFSLVLRPDLFQITFVFLTVCCRIPCQSCTIVEEVSGITWPLSLFLSVHVPICLVDKGIAKIEDQNSLIFCWCIYLTGTAFRTFWTLKFRRTEIALVLDWLTLFPHKFCGEKLEHEFFRHFTTDIVTCFKRNCATSLFGAGVSGK